MRPLNFEKKLVMVVVVVAISFLGRTLSGVMKWNVHRRSHCASNMTNGCQLPQNPLRQQSKWGHYKHYLLTEICFQKTENTVEAMYSRDFKISPSEAERFVL